MLKKTSNKIIQYYMKGIEKLGGEYKLYSNEILLCKKNKKYWYIDWSTVPINPSSSNKMQMNKFVVYKIFDENKIPTPKYRLFSNLKKALSSLSFSKPLIVKPYNQYQGKGVSCKIKTKEQFKRFFKEAKKLSEQILVEDFIKGDNYRFLVLGDRVISVAYRIKAHVIGDGKSKIVALIRKENKKRENHKYYKPIPIDDHMIIKLYHQKLTLDSVPTKGKKVVLRDTCNFAQGGTTEEVIDKVNKKNLDIAVKALKVLGLKAAGVDMITKDISKDIAKNHGVINEVNANFDLTLHYAAKNSRVDVAYEIQKFIYNNL